MFFEEKQRFNQWWIWLLTLSATIVPFVLFLNEWITNERIEKVLLFIIVAEILFVLLFKFALVLKTRVDSSGVHFQFFPFHLKFRTILWTAISSAYIRKYDPISEFGGWGIKGTWPFKNGRAYNVSGDEGLQLELTTGKKVLIGTNKTAELTEALNALKVYNKINAISI
ncbi:hypothetical protein [Solitalea canadensis]|uniref:Bacterial Pleckstrin homology domain-containing protein n=1 Tax=Solitalea canadensis (strain ATCC 29591 / DSM 3403 / JCM 21819 / LMG 8368 / NBRC 15130 / NCIMB 12057 / USAM 9D) TaxID=929556 RepID=H8KWS4_SOLCM|nr:hypothetical protein [Solitalea canadensis]AFD08253.1 hypothetical protein Solca_3243 [Solitalea canadensis DSM 3403]